MKRAGIIVLLIVMALPGLPAGAQGGTPTAPGDSCPAVVQGALDFIRNNCPGLESGEPCFGSEGETADGLSSLLPDPAVQYRVAALNVAGQGGQVTFVLLGDAALDLPPVTPITTTVVVVDAVANTNANLRDATGTNGAVVGNVSTGEALELVGKNDQGDWFQVLRADGSRAWIYGPLITIPLDADVLDLPVMGITLPGTGQDAPAVPSVGFRIGTATPGCPEAVAGLVLQSAAGTPVLFNLNQIPVTLNGTAIVLQGVAGADSVQVMTLAAGEISIDSAGQVLTTNTVGDTFVTRISLTAPLQPEAGPPVDVSALRYSTDQPTSSLIQRLCLNAQQTGQVQLEGSAGCDTLEVRFAPDDEEAQAAQKRIDDAAMDVLVCDTGAPVTGTEAGYADIAKVFFIGTGTADGGTLDVMMVAPPADAIANAFSFALVAWMQDANGNSNSGLLLQVHNGVQSIGLIDRNFNLTPGTAALVTTDADSAMFTLPAGTAGVELNSFLMATSSSPRVCDTTDYIVLY